MHEGQKVSTPLISNLRAVQGLQFERVDDSENESSTTAGNKQVQRHSNNRHRKQITAQIHDLDIAVPLTLPSPDLPSYNLYIPDGKPDHEIPLTLPPDDYITHDLTSGDTLNDNQGLSAGPGPGLSAEPGPGLSAGHEQQSMAASMGLLTEHSHEPWTGSRGRESLCLGSDDKCTDDESIPQLTSEGSDCEGVCDSAVRPRTRKSKRKVTFSSHVAVNNFDHLEPPNSTTSVELNTESAAKPIIRKKSSFTSSSNHQSVTLSVSKSSHEQAAGNRGSSCARADGGSYDAGGALEGATAPCQADGRGRTGGFHGEGNQYNVETGIESSLQNTRYRAHRIRDQGHHCGQDLSETLADGWTAQRSDGIRCAQGSQIRDGRDELSGLCGMGSQDGCRRIGIPPSSTPFRPLHPQPECQEGIQEGADSTEDRSHETGIGINEVRDELHVHRDSKGAFLGIGLGGESSQQSGGSDRQNGIYPGGHHCASSAVGGQDSGSRRHGRVGSQEATEPIGLDLSATFIPNSQLTSQQTKLLNTASQQLFQPAFTALTQYERAHVMELCCAADSGIVAETEKLGGKGIRATLSTGCDMSKPIGLRRAMQLWEQHQPEYLWVAAPCSHYSIQQNANLEADGTPTKLLKHKRRWARRIYENCLLLAELQIAAGRFVIWEWPRSCLAWDLPMMLKFLRKHQTGLHVTHLDGCAVGLRATDQFATQTLEASNKLW